jgi:isopentenyl diphosphate isomerase/L-lactate dehydrogenase-like FMN-dependent dehydrogenase
MTDPALHSGEHAVGRAAAGAGVPYTLSTLSPRSIEEVAAVSDGPKWFQVYVWRDRALVRDVVVEDRFGSRSVLRLNGMRVRSKRLVGAPDRLASP